MEINTKDLEEFRKHYKEVFGVELSQAEASEAANNLAELYLLLAQPLPSEQATLTKQQPAETDSRIPS